MELGWDELSGRVIGDAFNLTSTLGADFLPHLRASIPYPRKDFIAAIRAIPPVLAGV